MVTNDRPRTHAGRKAPGSTDRISTLFSFVKEVGALDRRRPLRVAERPGTSGPVTVLDSSFDSDSWIRCADERPDYQFNVVAAGRMELSLRGCSVVSALSLANVCLPEGELSVPRWTARSRNISLRINRSSVEETVSEALGREMTWQLEFSPLLPTPRGAAGTGMQMFSMVARDILRPDTAVRHPLVRARLVGSLTHALLFATDHTYRPVLSGQAKFTAPEKIYPALDIIESHPRPGLSVASLARRCGISSRALQRSVRCHLGFPPTTLLRQVRPCRAHRDLLASDPSLRTVTSIAKRWGYTNPGRFTAARAARYGETPAATLARSGRAMPDRRSKLSTSKTRQ